MPDLVDMFGAGGAQAIQFLIPLIFVLALIVILAWALKLIRHPTHRAMAKGRHPRLSKMDSTPIDARRSLILVRRDNVEHLILIGGSNDLVIESNISHASAPNQFQRPQRIEQPVIQQATGHPAGVVPNGGYPTPQPPMQDRPNNTAPVQEAARRPVQPTHSIPSHEPARTENTSKPGLATQTPVSVRTNAHVGQQPPVYPGATQVAAPSRLAATPTQAGKPISAMRAPVIPPSSIPKSHYPATAPQSPVAKPGPTVNPASLALKTPVLPVATNNAIEKVQSTPVTNHTPAPANSPTPVIPVTIAQPPIGETTAGAGTSDQSIVEPPRPIATSPLDMVSAPAAPVAPEASPVVQTANIPQSVQSTTTTQIMPSPAVSAPSNVSTGDAATDSIEEEMAKLLGELSAEPQKK
ncbi:MAG: flagellar biosynthetic protein FliO [Cohaesibacteraceae bacterium]|nr:flagellar biosynthetic protein FliO [Cohaesibacteraceae bacterium]